MCTVKQGLVLVQCFFFGWLMREAQDDRLHLYFASISLCAHVSYC